MLPPNEHHNRPSNDRAIRRRNAGRALIARLNRWLVAGAVVLTGAVTAAAAQAFPGHSRAVASPATSQTSHTDSLKPPAHKPSAAASSATASSAPSAPSASATSTPTPTPIVSGGS